MPRIAQVILALIVGLVLLTWAASGVVETTASEWFERDETSRAHLVLMSASHSLANAWNNSGELNGLMLAIAREERVMAVTACNPDFTIRATTPGFPPEFDCTEVGPRVRTAEPAPGEGAATFQEWSTMASLPTGLVQVSAMPIPSSQGELGFVIMVQDLNYIERREARARTFLIVIFVILAITAFGVPLIVARGARLEPGRCPLSRGILLFRRNAPLMNSGEASAEDWLEFPGCAFRLRGRMSCVSSKGVQLKARASSYDERDAECGDGENSEDDNEKSARAGFASFNVIEVLHHDYESQFSLRGGNGHGADLHEPGGQGGHGAPFLECRRPFAGGRLGSADARADLSAVEFRGKPGVVARMVKSGLHAVTAITRSSRAMASIKPLSSPELFQALARE